MDRVERPLSPHLQVYRWQITMALSILHRAPGVALSVGLLVLVFWLVTVASGEAAYADAQPLLGNGLLKLCYVGWCFCFFYHLANGVRHLSWDLGVGLEPVQYRISGWLVVAIAVAATAAYSLAVVY